MTTCMARIQWYRCLDLRMERLPHVQIDTQALATVLRGQAVLNDVSATGVGPLNTVQLEPTAHRVCPVESEQIWIGQCDFTWANQDTIEVGLRNEEFSPLLLVTGTRLAAVLRATTPWIGLRPNVSHQRVTACL